MSNTPRHEPSPFLDTEGPDPYQTSPDSSNIWWGSGQTMTFIFDPAGAGSEALTGDQVPGGMTMIQPPEPRAAKLPAPDLGLTASMPTPTPASPGRYLVGAVIGSGGVGVVRQGWDVQLKRAVAIKVLREEHKTKPDVSRRFLEEARITGRLQHPGIVPVHELGVSPDGRPFFVMHLLHGQTLEQILNRRDDDPCAELPRLLTIFLQVCQAIAYAHSQGVIHRDLKSANIMVGAFGVVKVMDWGLAKILGEPDLPDAVSAAQVAAELTTRCSTQDPRPIDSTLPGTQVGTVFGTPAYLPPEQARGEIDRLDQRSDVFGLGSILCEILTGRPPYTGSSGRSIYHKAVAADLSEAYARLNACPAALDLVTLAKWCLSPSPDDRPAYAADLVEVMTNYMQANQRRAEQDLVRFFDLSLDLFCIAGTDGYFHRVNENFPRLLGYTSEELTSRPFIDFVHPEDRTITESILVQMAAGTPCIQFLNRYRHARGHYLWLEWNAQTVHEERAIYAVARDVTERIAQAEAFSRRNVDS